MKIWIIVLLVLALAAPVAAVTPGQWDFGAGADHAREAAQEAIQGREITYDCNGGFWLEWKGWFPAVQTSRRIVVMGSHAIPEEIPWGMWGQEFQGWLAPNGVIYQPGEVLGGLGDMTLTAQWGRADRSE